MTKCQKDMLDCMTLVYNPIEEELTLKLQCPVCKENGQVTFDLYGGYHDYFLGDLVKDICDGCKRNRI